MKERRRHKRFKIVLADKYTKSGGYVTIHSSGTTRDISLGGIRARVSKVVKRRNTILLELTSPYQKKLAVLARVVWTKSAGPNKGNICGLKLLWVSSTSLLKSCVEFAKEISDAA